MLGGGVEDLLLQQLICGSTRSSTPHNVIFLVFLGSHIVEQPGLPCIPATSAKKKGRPLTETTTNSRPKGKGLRGGRGTVTVTAEWWYINCERGMASQGHDVHARQVWPSYQALREGTSMHMVRECAVGGGPRRAGVIGQRTLR
jgi:hypothetical protein